MSKISEIISKLKEKKAEFGDIDVVLYDTDWQCYYDVDADDEDFVVGDLVRDGNLQLSINGISPYDKQ